MGYLVDKVKTEPKVSAKDQHHNNGLALRLLLLFLLLPALGIFGWRAYENLPGEPLELTYEIDILISRK